MIEFILAFIYASIITALLNFKLLIELYQIPSKQKIKKWIKSQNWFVYYYDLYIFKDWKNCYIGISTVSNEYSHCITFDVLEKIQEFLKCKSIEVTENNKCRIFMRVKW